MIKLHTTNIRFRTHLVTFIVMDLNLIFSVNVKLLLFRKGYKGIMPGDLINNCLCI